MRTAAILSTLIIAQMALGICASGQSPPALADRPLILIPTALQELTELRSNTGKRGPQRDGTTNDLYVKHIPSKGNIYLNFHLDVASKAGTFLLRGADICLKAPAVRVAAASATSAKGQTTLETPVTASYTPLDWFVDTGLDESRGDPLAVRDKALVQFTIEVPRAGLDDLSLFIRSQRIGTVREIREQIARDRGGK